jgi:hypothetical protein
MDIMAQAVTTILIVLIAAWTIRMIMKHREKMEERSAPRVEGAASDARLARVEQAVEAIAIEIERVSEGQRFVTKLMNERAQAVPRVEGVAAAVPVQVRRVDTPH